MKNTKRKRQAAVSSLLREVDSWKAVQGKPLSYKEKQNLADIFRKREELARLRRRLRGNQVGNRAGAINRATSIEDKAWLRPPVTKWDDCYVPY
jgi:hypothetical protein